MESLLQLVLVLTVMCVINVNDAARKNKLYNYSIPENRALKKSLGFHEDTYLNFTELASKYKYNTEQHTVQTDDGYILTMFRILSKCDRVNSYPVLLLHGIMDSSDLWILSGPNTGLGYILSDNCYDVWAANHRGNHYSRKHVKLDPDTDSEYWNFSLDEHGNYDLPALVDYVLSNTKQQKLFYIGHSQGTTNFFVMTSLRPEYNDKIALSIHLAPVAWLANLASPFPIIAAQGSNYIKDFLDGAGYYEILARDQVMHFMIELICQMIPDLFCGNILTITTGYQGKINSKLISIAFGHVLDGISTKNLAHFGQLILSKKFQRYDEGRQRNLKRYGRTHPPKYNVSKVTSPVVLMNAQNDWISTIKDTKILVSKLPNVVESYVAPDRYWSHHNLIWGTQAQVYVFPKILEYFKKFGSA